MKMFDGIFGEKHFTRRCFIRSSIASFLCFIFASLLIISISYIENIFEFIKGLVLVFIFYGTTLNLFGDYLSLLETRVPLSDVSSFLTKRDTRERGGPVSGATRKRLNRALFIRRTISDLRPQGGRGRGR